MAPAPAPRRTEPDPPSADEAAALLNASWIDQEWGLLLWLTTLTGPRRGEVSALRWRYIDFDRGLLWVHRSNAQTKTGLVEKSMKTGRRRKIALDEHTVDLLRHTERCGRTAVGPLGVPLRLDAHVFSPAPDGSAPYLPHAITRRYRRLAMRLKPPQHTVALPLAYSATELVAAGVDTVAGRLGHGSGGATTLKAYAAWVDEADRRAATTMAAVLPRRAPKASLLVSPYEAIATSLRDQIATGELKPGDELPTVAQLAVATPSPSAQRTGPRRH